MAGLLLNNLYSTESNRLLPNNCRPFFRTNYLKKSSLRKRLRNPGIFGFRPTIIRENELAKQFSQCQIL
jgi:hypothetical protein